MAGKLRKWLAMLTHPNTNPNPHQEQDTLPWRPLFTIERSKRAEVTAYGIISLVDSSNLLNSAENKPLLGIGDTDFQLWSRSLLKPWQLLNHIQVLKAAYPTLKDEHYAFFMASHSAEPGHIKLLEEIEAITGASEKALKCPPAAPLSSETKELLKTRGEKNGRRYHNCSGKHLGYLAAIAAEGRDIGNYLVESELHHSRLKKIMSALTGRGEETFIHTTDGCQLPNYALSTKEMAALYLSLFNSRPVFTDPLISACQAYYPELGQIMHRYPRTISGGNRLDYKIMGQNLLGNSELQFIAKEGADGLLGLAMAPCSRYPQGLGLCIKLSAGFDNRHMELLVREIFERLALIEPLQKTAADTAGVKTDHIKTHFHFELERRA